MLLSFDKATADELPVVLDLLDDAAERLQRQGIDQWPPRFSGVSDWRGTRIRTYVEAGHAWLVRVNGKAIATFALTDKADPDFAEGWPEGPDDALYIYRMAVLRDYAGH